MSMVTLEEEKYFVASGMCKFGGSFVSSLGDAIHLADSNNTKRIKDAFPEYWAEYLPKEEAEYEKEQEEEQ